VSRHIHQRCVRITNPLPDGKTYTSGRRARRYVDEERARWTDASETVIEFIISHRHYRAARWRQCVVTAVMEGDSGMATLAGIRGIPVINPIELITDRSKRRVKRKAA